VPLGTFGTNSVEKREVERIVDRYRRIEYGLDSQAIEDSCRTADMISMRVGDDQHRHLRRASTLEKRCNDPASSIAAPTRSSRIDHEPPTSWGPDDRGISLTHIEVI
jgi:hypothetical protein